MTSILPETDVRLRDGATVHVRPIEPGDRDAMREFLGSLSEESRRLRYFSGGANMDWAAGDAADGRLPDHYGIVAIRGGDRIVAHATYGRAGHDRAEVAFAVADEMQGRGIATTLLTRLAETADKAGIGWFEAQVLPENHKMVEVFRDSGFEVRMRWHAGVIEVEFPTKAPPRVPTGSVVHPTRSAPEPGYPASDPSLVSPTAGSQRTGRTRMSSTITHEVPTGGALHERPVNLAPRAPRGPKKPLLAKLTGLTAVAAAAAAGMIVVGILAVVGGNYDKQVVRDQLTPQKVFFPPAGSPALLPGVKQYAGQQVVNGDQAHAYANNFIGVHLSKIAGGKTYSEVSTAAMADPKNAALAAQKATLFQGETLRGLLLNAWGWSLVGTIATIAGFVLIGLGAVLLLLPLANWRVNIKGRTASSALASS